MNCEWDGNSSTIRGHGMNAWNVNIKVNDHLTTVVGGGDDDDVAVTPRDIVLVRENGSIYLLHGANHRLTHPGRIDLEVIEVRTGSYLGKDEIIRFEDT